MVQRAFLFLQPRENTRLTHYNLNLRKRPSGGFLLEARMDVTVNGEVETLAQVCNVADFLTARGHDAQRVVVERNGEILPRECFSQTTLSEGDRLEIVHFVGGG